MDVTAALALGRFGRDASALLLWGASLYLALLVPPDLRRALALGWGGRRRAALALLVVSVTALLPLQAASLGQGWPDAFDPTLTRDLLTGTTIGTAWMVQAGATGLLLAAATVPSRWGDAATAAFSGILLAALSLTGHAAAREGLVGAAQRGCEILHLLAGGFWFGALLPLLPTLRVLPQPALHRDAITALRRFSWIGHAAVALVILTGIGNTVLITGGWPSDWTSPYLRLLFCKVTLVAAMAVLAVVNRYRFVPRLAGDGAAALLDLRRATVAEIVLGTGAVALVALFGLLDPT